MPKKPLQDVGEGPEGERSRRKGLGHEKENRSRKKPIPEEAERRPHRRSRQIEEEPEKPLTKKSQKKKKAESDSLEHVPSRAIPWWLPQVGWALAGGILVFLALIGLGLWFFVGQENKHERMMEELIQTNRECAEVLHAVKDRVTASQAIPKLEELSERRQTLLRKQRENPPDAAEEERLRTKYDKEKADSEQQLAKALFTALPKAGNDPAFMAALRKFPAR
jgi:hypothetical protein